MAMKMIKVSAELASKHYEPLLERRSKKEVAEAVSAITSEPCVATCWKGLSAVSAVLSLAGDEDPAVALPGTIRGDLCMAAAGTLVECAHDAHEVRC